MVPARLTSAPLVTDQGGQHQPHRPPDIAVLGVKVSTSNPCGCNLDLRRGNAIDQTAADSLLGGFAALETQHPKEPHWYLCFAGVEPRLQGRGIGTATLAPALELADKSRSLCYLETPFPRTHAFYRRLGYEIIRKGNPFRGAPSVWAMLRAPTSAPPTA